MIAIQQHADAVGIYSLASPHPVAFLTPSTAVYTCKSSGNTQLLNAAVNLRLACVVVHFVAGEAAECHLQLQSHCLQLQSLAQNTTPLWAQP